MYKNKQIIITGGCNGIGRAIAEAFLAQGAKVSVIDIDKEAGEEFAGAFENLCFFCGDIAEKTALESFVNSIKSPVDCVINNACLSAGGVLSDCSYGRFEYVQKVGVTAPYYIVSLLLSRKLLAKGASIINVSSTRAFQSQADTESYSAAKGGITALTHALAVSLAGKARVNSISPGWIETGKGIKHSKEDKSQHPAGRVGMPKDISETVLFLCDNEKAGFITGQNFIIDGGMSSQMIYHGDKGWTLKN